MVTMDHL